MATRPRRSASRVHAVIGPHDDRHTGESLREGVICADGVRRPIAAMFVDSAFGSPVVERLHVLGYEMVQEVNFGGKSPDIHFANMRSYMWAKGVKEWLERGCIAKDDEKMCVDLTSPGFHLNKSNALVLEAKADMAKRGGPHPMTVMRWPSRSPLRWRPLVPITSTKVDRNGTGQRRPYPNILT
jgi:hypothetical protein